MDWNAAKATGGYILDNRLRDTSKMILVTYKTRTGRRFVKQVLSDYGFLHKKLPGVVVAWAPMPEPYRGKAATAGTADLADLGPLNHAERMCKE